MRLTKMDIELLLDDFTKAVSAKQVERIPYADWKKLKSAKAWNIEDDIDFLPIVRIFDDDDRLLFKSTMDDDSFGTFISDEVFGKGVSTMPPKDNDTYSWNDTKLTYSYNPNGTITNVDYNRSISNNDYYNTYGTTLGFTDVSSPYVTKAELEHAIKHPTNKSTKENNKEMKGFNFDFGPIKTDSVKISVYGLAVKNTNGTYVSYDATKGNLMDVDILNFDGSKFLYKMPVAIKDIKIGDVVVHNRIPMFVTDIGADAKSLVVVDPVNGEKKDIMLTRSPFGFDFATKIVNIIGNMSADADNPFGNIWMFALVSGDDKNTSGDSSFANLAPLMLMNQTNLNIDPMMMLLLCDNRKDNLLPLMFMMNKTNTPEHTCNCGGKCAEIKAD